MLTSYLYLETVIQDIDSKVSVINTKDTVANYPLDSIKANLFFEQFQGGWRLGTAQACSVS